MSRLNFIRVYVLTKFKYVLPSLLGVSFLHTWINVAITIAGQVSFALIIDPHLLDAVVVLSMTVLPFQAISIIMLILVQILHRCRCCGCCNSDCCNPITERTLLNVDDPLEQIFFDRQKNNKCEDDIEMNETNC